MPRVVKRSASAEAIKSGPSRRSRPNSPLPQFVPPQLSQLVEKPPSGPQWVHEIKRFGFAPKATVSRRVGRIDRLGDHAFEAELAGVLQDEFAVARLVAIELKAGLV